MKRAIQYRSLQAVRSSRRRIEIPAFAYPNTWAGVSQMLGRYSIGNTNKYSLKLPITPPDNSFVAAVSWAESPYVYRYKLWDAGVLFFPLYNGERIGSNSYLEIWNVDGYTTAILDENWILQASKLILPNICADCTTNYETVAVTEVPFSSLPSYQHCNPFCSPLCV